MRWRQSGETITYAVYIFTDGGVVSRPLRVTNTVKNNFSNTDYGRLSLLGPPVALRDLHSRPIMGGSWQKFWQDNPTVAGRGSSWTNPTMAPGGRSWTWTALRILVLTSVVLEPALRTDAGSRTTASGLDVSSRTTNQLRHELLFDDARQTSMAKSSSDASFGTEQEGAGNPHLPPTSLLENRRVGGGTAQAHKRTVAARSSRTSRTAAAAAAGTTSRLLSSAECKISTFFSPTFLDDT